jgi:hypothetical protein
MLCQLQQLEKRTLLVATLSYSNNNKFINVSNIKWDTEIFTDRM